MFLQKLYYQVEDLCAWAPVLEKLDTMLYAAGNNIATCDCLDLSVDPTINSAFIAAAILKFMTLLLKCSKDKRFFLPILVRI
jgi:hypothetical protein